jgi:hypothetical protein
MVCMPYMQVNDEGYELLGCRRSVLKANEKSGADWSKNNEGSESCLLAEGTNDGSECMRINRFFPNLSKVLESLEQHII